MPKRSVFGRIRAWAQFGPNCRKAANECFWAHSGFGPIWSKKPECQKGVFLGTFGLGPNLVRTAGVPKTNAFGYIRAWVRLGPNCRNAEKEGFLGTFKLGPNLVRTPGRPKTNVFGHVRAWAQFGPNSRNAKNECFWAPSGLGPIWSELPECRKRMFLGTFGLGPNLIRTPGRPKRNVFSAHSSLGPKAFVLGSPGVRTKLGPSPNVPKSIRFGLSGSSDQIGPKPERAQKHLFSAFRQFGPNWAQARTCPKTFVFGIPGVWAHSGLGPI